MRKNGRRGVEEVVESEDFVAKLLRLGIKKK